MSGQAIAPAESEHSAEEGQTDGALIHTIEAEVRHCLEGDAGHQDHGGQAGALGT